MANDINFNLGHTAKQIRIRPTFDLLAYLKDRSVVVHFLYLRALAINNRYKLVRSDVLAERSLIPVELGLIDSYGFHMLNYPVDEEATYMKKSSDLIQHACRSVDRCGRDLFRYAPCDGWLVDHLSFSVAEITRRYLELTPRLFSL